MTPLDVAHADMEAAPDDDLLRMRFYERLAESELFVLLEQDRAEVPQLFETEVGSFILVFDREDRLTEFAEGAANYAALSGRSAAQMVKGQNVGLALNIGVAPSSFLMPVPAVDWLNQTLEAKPKEQSALPERFEPPGALPDQLLTSLDAKLATAEGLASKAFLVAVTYRDGRRGHLLAIADAAPAAQPALARAISEAVIFSGVDAGELDVVFVASGDPVTEKLANVGLRFDLPELVLPKAPTVDPTKPPKLR